MDRFDMVLRFGARVVVVAIDRQRSAPHPSTAFSQSKIRDLTAQGSSGTRVEGHEDGGSGRVTAQLLIGDVFRGAARAAPHRTAAALGQESITFAELDAAA